jgi:Spy/CpxP family protein refolding chaperone
MRPNLAPRVQAVVLLLLVATAGAVAGIVGDRLISDRQEPIPARDAVRGAPGAGPWRWEPRTDVRYAERLSSVLELTAAQQQAIDSIVNDQQQRARALTAEVQPRFRAIAEQTRSSIEDVLTPEQRERLRGLREERVRTMRREWRGSREDDGEGAGVRRPLDRRPERMRDRARSDTLPMAGDSTTLRR